MPLEREEREESVQPQERVAFNGQSASGHARQHVGNVFNNTYYRYGVQKRRSDETLREDQRNKQLLKAAAAGHTPRVKHLLQLGADLDFSDDVAGFTALHHAALSGFEDTVDLLLDLGADVAARSLDQRSPLHLASLKGRLNVVKLLLRFRADPNETSEAVGHPLHCASAAGSVDVVRELLAHGSTVDPQACVDFNLMYPEMSLPKDDWRTQRWQCRPLLLAAISGSAETCDTLLEKGASPDALGWHMSSARPALDTRLEKPLPREPFNMGPELGISPLRGAVRYGHMGVTTVLLPSSIDGQAKESLIMAGYLGHTEIVGLLLEHVDSPDVTDAGGDTALISAATGGHSETVRVLIQAGASVNFVTRISPSALHSIHSRAVTRTALHAAIRARHAHVVSALLEHNADPQIPDLRGLDCHGIVLEMLNTFTHQRQALLQLQEILDRHSEAQTARRLTSSAPGQRQLPDHEEGGSVNYTLQSRGDRQLQREGEKASSRSNRHNKAVKRAVVKHWRQMHADEEAQAQAQSSVLRRDRDT